VSRAVDCIVLGAGFVGLGAALALQARGRSVAIIDRLGAPAGETSFGNTGIVQS
jgi:D-amino-acid dehydrogenase